MNSGPIHLSSQTLQENCFHGTYLLGHRIPRVSFTRSVVQSVAHSRPHLSEETRINVSIRLLFAVHTTLTTIPNVFNTSKSTLHGPDKRNSLPALSSKVSLLPRALPSALGQARTPRFHPTILHHDDNITISDRSRPRTLDARFYRHLCTRHDLTHRSDSCQDPEREDTRSHRQHHPCSSFCVVYVSHDSTYADFGLFGLYVCYCRDAACVAMMSLGSWKIERPGDLAHRWLADTAA